MNHSPTVIAGPKFTASLDRTEFIDNKSPVMDYQQMAPTHTFRIQSFGIRSFRLVRNNCST
jgi:hypothetical protein